MDLADFPERFASKVAVTDDGCWAWTGVLNNRGYPKISVGGKKGVYAHRYAYELAVGAIPPGLHIDHLCLVKRCVNPVHLEAVTPRENCRRWAETITHCPHGHPYVPGGFYLSRGRYRQCRPCQIERVRRYRKAQQEAREA